jgi:hypothetical protein
MSRLHGTSREVEAVSSSKSANPAKQIYRVKHVKYAVVLFASNNFLPARCDAAGWVARAGGRRRDTIKEERQVSVANNSN